MSAEKGDSKLWVFLNSNFGLFFFSSIVLSFVTWSYTEWTHSIEQHGVNAENATKLDTEISYRIRLVQNYFKSDCAEHINLSWDTFQDIRNIYKAEPDYQSIFPENRQKDLHILIWERRALVDASEKQVYFESFVALLDFTAYLNRFLASRENVVDDDGKSNSESNNDSMSAPANLALWYGNNIDFRAEVNKLEKDFLSATAAITEEQESVVGINAARSSANASPSPLDRGASGSATAARVPRLENIGALREFLDATITIEEALDKPFLMAIEDAFSISGRGTVVTGRVERGIIKVGEEIEIVGFGETQTTTVAGVEMFRKSLDEGRAGNNVGVLLRGTKRDEVERGQVLAHVGSITSHTRFEAEVYMLSKEGGGRHTPFFKGYRPQFYFRTTDVTGAVKLPEGVEMVMPGDNIQMQVALIEPIAMEEGLRFAIREGGRTVGAGMVTDVIE